MKILIIGPAHPLRGGIAAFNERLAHAFIENGHEVLIETFSLQYPGFLFPGKTQYSDSEAPKALSINVSINSINPFNWMKTGRRLKKMEADVVIVAFWMPFMGPCLGWISGLIRKNGRSSIIALTHNLLPHEKRIGDKLLTRFFTKKVDGFLTMSKSVLNEIGIFSPGIPAVFSPHPIYDHFGAICSREEALDKLGLDPSWRYLLFFGIIREYKGLDLILKALASNKLADFKIRLIVAGEFYSDSAPYLNIIRENNLIEKVVIKSEFIPDDKVADYFNAADLITQTYKTATQSGVTQVGFHFEKPMLVTNVGGLAEIIPDRKAGYVTECDPEQIAEAIADFFANNRLESLTQGVIEEKRKYSWQGFYTNFISLLESIK